MGLQHHVIAWIFKFLNLVDRLLQLFGIKICRVTRETILKGFPDEIHDEINQPDIKFLFNEFVKGIEKDTQMTLYSRFVLLYMCRKDLNQRLLLKKTLQEIPDLLQVQIKRPVFILGPPRTGTTFLQWFLTEDKNFRTLKMWEMTDLFPPGKVEDSSKDPRHKEVASTFAIREAYINPSFYSAHPVEADKPDECFFLWSRSFYCELHKFALDCLDQYARKIDNLGNSETMKHVYSYYKQSLQVLAYNQGMENRRFLLKAPVHLRHMETLLETFPDAQLIFTHRPISQIMPSFLSLMAHLFDDYGGSYNLKFKKRVIAAMRSWLVCAARSLHRLEEKGSRNPMYLAYKDLTADPLGETRKLYDFLGMTLTPDTESAFRHYLENDPKKTKYGVHKYTMEQFGLTKEDLKEEFKEYIDFMTGKGFPEEDVL